MDLNQFLTALLGGGIVSAVLSPIISWRIANKQASTERMKLRFEIMRRRVEGFDAAALALKAGINKHDLYRWYADDEFPALAAEVTRAAELVSRVPHTDFFRLAQTLNQRAGDLLIDQIEGKGKTTSQGQDPMGPFLRAASDFTKALQQLQMLVDDAAEERLSTP